MDLAGKIKNAFSAFTKTENSGAQGVSGTDFLKYGNRGRKIMWDESSNVKMSDVEFYKGYSYAAINNRANKVAQLAEENLKTKAADKMMADARARNEDIVHPYLTLIDESDDFTNYEFWYAISTYLDLEGVYYLMAVRAVSPSLIGNVQSFVMLNPYNVQRVINKETMQVGGYIETVNGMQREIPKEMIIEMRKLNPFSNDTNFAMTDAAKDSQFTLQQANDYTRSSLKNNLSAPGIITTDVLMDREMFQNFQARVLSQEKGAPLFGNGAGSINYEPMQIDMDKAALLDINKMSRDQLFAVTGVSPSTLGIDEAGTTRDVSKTQKDKFIEDHIMPQMQLIFDALNQDYKKYYKKEWDKNKYRIYVDNPLSADKDAESKDIEIADSSYKLYDQLVADGYDRDIAAKYAAGEITLEELGDPTNEPRPNPIVEAAMLKAGENPQNPNLVAPKEDTKKKDDASKKKPSDEKKIESFLTQNHEEFEHEHEIDIEMIKNDFDSETATTIDTQQGRLENAISNIEGEIAAKVIRKVQRTKNAFENPDDVMSARDKATFINELTLVLATYYLSLFPAFANQLIKTRAQEFGQQGNFRMTKAIERYIQVTARRASDSHINTIINDIQKTAHEAYEEELARHLKDAKDAGKSGAESYEYARKRALEGASQQRIISEITTKYQDISKNRAKTIARTETNRAFTQSQFQADLQFLKDTGLMDSAYKQWVTRSENPCPYCLELASRGPIPFDENFESLGAELHYDYTKKNGEIVKRTLKIDYEDLEAGNAHVNCQCKYKLIIKDANGNFVENGFRFAKVLNKGYNPNRDPKTGKFSTGKSGGMPESKRKIIYQSIIDNYDNFDDRYKIFDEARKQAGLDKDKVEKVSDYSDGATIVYKGTDSNEPTRISSWKKFTDFNGNPMRETNSGLFLSPDKNYASQFGNKVYEFGINKKAKILDTNEDFGKSRQRIIDDAREYFKDNFDNRVKVTDVLTQDEGLVAVIGGYDGYKRGGWETVIVNRSVVEEKIGVNNSLSVILNAGKGNPNRDPKSGKFSTGPDGPDSKLYSRNPTKAKIVRADKDEKPKLERAMRYLSTNELMPDIKISTAKLGTKYGNTSGKNIYIDSDTIKSQPATFVASILFHEGVHTKQDIKMPSMKRESEARFKTKMWAGFKAGSKDIDSDEKAGFLKAVKEQG